MEQNVCQNLIICNQNRDGTTYYTELQYVIHSGLGAFFIGYFPHFFKNSLKTGKNIENKGLSALKKGVET